MTPTRTFAAFVATALIAGIVLAPTASAIPPPLEYAEKFVKPRGFVLAGICNGEGVGAGGDVNTHWELVYRNRWGGSESFEGYGPAFAGAVVGPCMTYDCAYVTLYADGRVVASDAVCWIL